MHYSRFLIKENDQFISFDFPQIEEDLDVLVASMAKQPSLLNTEKLLSFVKDRNMRAEWVEANPALAVMFSSNALPVKNLEALFASSSRNPHFRIQLEEYITQKFREAA